MMIERNYEDDNNNDYYYPIIIAKDSNLQLPLSSSSSSINIAKWKDERLEHLDIPKGLIEVLQSNGFTVEKILDCGPSHIVEILGIDDYIGEIIYQETRKATRNIISNSNF
jgi:hypothetical protein